MESLEPVREPLDLGRPLVSEEPAPGVAQVGHYRACPPVRSRRLRQRARMGRWLPGQRILGLIVLTLGAHWMWHNGPRSLEPRPLDLALMPSAGHLARLSGSFQVDEELVRFARSRNFGGGETLRYEYDSEEGRGPEVRTLVWTDETEEEARETFRKTALHTVFDWGVGMREEVGLIELDPDGRWAEESAVYRVQAAGRDVGYSVTLREGLRTLHARIRGVNLEPSKLRTYVRPFVRQARR